VLRVDTSFSLGFLKPCSISRFGLSETAFGTPGAGGSFGFADPDAGLGFAYVMNRMGFHLIDDPREKALRDATYRCLAGQGQAVEARPQGLSRGG
jgi:CubicO group peptidase (beta-lactamase class C family)